MFKTVNLCLILVTASTSQNQSRGIVPADFIKSSQFATIFKDAVSGFGGWREGILPRVTYKPNVVAEVAGWELAHISRKRDFNALAAEGSCCAKMPRGSSKWKRRT